MNKNIHISFTYTCMHTGIHPAAETQAECHQRKLINIYFYVNLQANKFLPNTDKFPVYFTKDLNPVGSLMMSLTIASCPPKSAPKFQHRELQSTQCFLQ